MDVTTTAVPVDARIEAFFGDAVYPFRLALGDIRDLEAKLRASSPGVFELHGRFLAMRVSSTELRETLRIGLIGGGMKASEAHLMMERWFRPPFIPLVRIALDLLDAAMLAPPGEPVTPGKPAAEADPAWPSPTSTEPAAP